MPRPLTNSTPRGKSRPLRERLSLRLIMTWTNVVSILFVSLAAGYYAFNILYQNKLSDTWAIMFLELEHQGALLTDKLQKIALSSSTVTDGEAVLRVTKDGKVEVERGGFSNNMTLADFNLKQQADLQTLPLLSVFMTNGDTYLARVKAARLMLRRVAASTFEVKPAPPASEGSLYLLTREGRLIYSSDTAITESTTVDRPLVQKFIKTSITQGQLELQGADGEPFYGFFSEVPRTNLVMFSEVRQSVAMAPVRQVVFRFLAVLGLILIGAVIILQIPLLRLTGPIRELAQLAQNVGQGRFDVQPKVRGFGELSALTSAFSSMANGLIERDRKVASLMREQTERARLEGELAIARRIQENLLPERSLPIDSGLNVAAQYIPAAECAGDWYHYAYNPDRRESVVILADVSGHGAGSSMFTAVIAGLFDDFRYREGKDFDMLAFAHSVNDVIFRLGRMHWHATMVIARYIAGQANLDLLIAGHPPPIIRNREREESLEKKMIFPGSTVLGMSREFKPTQQSIPFPKGTSLLMYTDGLTEAQNKAGKMYLKRRARDVFVGGLDDPRAALIQLLEHWEAFREGASPGDDVCVIAMRAA